MSPTLQPIIARLSPAEKLQLVGELWDELAASDLEFALTPAQQAELRAEREAIRHDPQDGAPWPEVKARLLRQK